jgi:predicted sugar kinase
MEQSRQTSSTQLARQLGRSRRSAIGTVGFDRGGFLFDHGTGANSQTEHSYDRVLFPDKWRMVLITPQTEAGLSGSQEEAYFDKPRFMAADVVEQQVSLIRNDILPSLLQQDLPAFRTALETYGRIIGEYFAPEQGGVFSSQQVQKLADWLKTKDVTGIVQSSWGPTVCIPAESDEAALDLQQLISQAPDADQFSVRIASGMNSGATISSPAPETFDHVFRG